MAIAKLFFKGVLQNSQDYGNNDEHMISHVIFDLEIEGKRHENLYATIKQPVGSSFESANLEIYRPINYKGHLFNYTPYRSKVESYFRGIIGLNGTGIGFSSPGVSNLCMRDNWIEHPCTDEFEVQLDSDGSW